MVLSAAVFWGLNGIATKVLYRDVHVDAFELLVARGLFTLPLFALLALAARPPHSPSAAEWRRLLLIGLCYGPIACGFLALGAQYTSGAHISFLFSLAPPLTAVVGGLILRERVTPVHLTALGLGLAGAALLATTHSATGSSLVGDLYMLVQVVGLCGTFVITRSLGRRYNALFVTGIFGAVGMLGIVVVGALGGGAAGMLQVASDPASAAWFFGEIVIGLSVYSQLAQTWALRSLTAVTTSVLASYGALIVGTVGALTILGERISVTGIVAGGLIALALGLALVPTPASSRAG